MPRARVPYIWQLEPNCYEDVNARGQMLMKCWKCYEDVKSVTTALNRQNSDYDGRKSKIEQTIIHSMFEYLTGLIEDCDCQFNDQKKYPVLRSDVQSEEDTQSQW